MFNPKKKPTAGPASASLEIKKLQAFYLAGGRCVKCGHRLDFYAFELPRHLEGWRIALRVPYAEGGGDHTANRIAICTGCGNY